MAPVAILWLDEWAVEPLWMSWCGSNLRLCWESNPGHVAHNHSYPHKYSILSLNKVKFPIHGSHWIDY